MVRLGSFFVDVTLMKKCMRASMPPREVFAALEDMKQVGEVEVVIQTVV